MVEQNEHYQWEVAKLRAERDLHREKAQRVANAIAEPGPLADAAGHVGGSRQQHGRTEPSDRNATPPDIKASTFEIRDYALKPILHLKSLLRSVTQKTKVKLAQHVKELVLTPGRVARTFTK